MAVRLLRHYTLHCAGVDTEFLPNPKDSSVCLLRQISPQMVSTLLDGWRKRAMPIEALASDLLVKPDEVAAARSSLEVRGLAAIRITFSLPFFANSPNDRRARRIGAGCRDYSFQLARAPGR